MSWLGDAWDATGGWALDQIGGALGTQGGSAKAPKYGEARSGGGPNRDNYYLGGYEGYADQYSDQSFRAGQDQQTRQEGYANQLNATGYQANQAQQNVAGQAYGMGQDAYNRGISNVGYGGAQADANAQRAAAGQLGGYANQFQQMAGAPEGPSAAQAQLQQGTNDALSSQLALMRSGGSAGSSAAAADNARFNAAGIQANNANASAALRSQETNAYRQRQMEALGMAGQAQSAAAGVYGQGADRATQQAQFNAQNRLAQQQQNDATGLAGMGLAGQSYNAGYGQQLQAQQAAAAASGAGYDALKGGRDAGYQANLANLQGGMGYEGQLGDMYGAELGHQLGMRERDQAGGQAAVGGVAGAFEGLMGMAAMSDRRAKKKIKPSSVLAEYRALGGE